MGDLGQPTIFSRHRSKRLSSYLCPTVYMSEKSFNDVCQLKADIHKFFRAQPGSFYKDGICSLPNKLRIVVDNNRDYIVD